MSEVMYTCIILHNMIFEDKGNAIYEYNENMIILPTQVFEVGSDEYLARRAIIHENIFGTSTTSILTRNRSTIWKVNFPMKMFFRSI